MSLPKSSGSGGTGTESDAYSFEMKSSGSSNDLLRKGLAFPSPQSSRVTAMDSKLLSTELDTRRLSYGGPRDDAKAHGVVNPYMI